MKVKLKVIGLTFSQIQTGAYAIILAEVNGKRRVPVIVGTSEAQSVAIFLDELVPPRPLTHDLFCEFAKAANYKLKEVYLHDYTEGVFYTDIIFTNGQREIVLDGRPSDALSLALRFNALITIEEKALRKTCITMEDEELFGPIDELEEEPSPTPETMDIDDLRQALEDAIETEDYEQASYLRDIIEKRKS